MSGPTPTTDQEDRRCAAHTGGMPLGEEDASSPAFQYHQSKLLSRQRCPSERSQPRPVVTGSVTDQGLAPSQMFRWRSVRRSTLICPKPLALGVSERLAHLLAFGFGSGFLDGSNPGGHGTFDLW